MYLARVPLLPDGAADACHLADDALDLEAGTWDLEPELEHQELAMLLDQAMALLSPVTRAILVGCYIDRLAHADLALRLGISEGAVKVRLHRGKRALRRVLLNEFTESARAYRLLPPASERWEETRMWCTFCGQQRLLGRFTRQGGAGEFALHCPGCMRDRGLIYHRSDTTLLGGPVRYRPALARIAIWASQYFRDVLRQGTAPCHGCGRQARLRIDVGTRACEASNPYRDLQMLVVTCGHYGCVNVQCHVGLILASARGQAFWRMHPHIRLLPDRAVEAQGCATLVTSFVSLTDGARLDVLSARETLEVLDIK